MAVRTGTLVSSTADFLSIDSIRVDQDSTESPSVTGNPCCVSIVSSDLDFLSKFKMGHSSTWRNVTAIIFHPSITDDVIILSNAKVSIIGPCHHVSIQHVGTSYGCIEYIWFKTQILIFESLVNDSTWTVVCIL